jgi:hypothetical protein
MRARFLGLATVGLGLIASAAFADDPGRPVRLIGQAPSAADPAAKAFVLDLWLTKGDGAFKQDIKGWYAALPPDPAASGEVSGTCVSSACVVNVDVPNAKLSLTGDFTTGAAGAGGFALADDDDKPTAQGAASFAPLPATIPGVGEIAAPDAVTGTELKSLLEWAGQSVSSDSYDPDVPDDNERDTLASWQSSHDEPATGLITTADLVVLRKGAADGKAAAGWTVIGDKPGGDKAKGWSAGYPAALMPKAETVGREQHFSSADGKASLVVAVDPPVSGDDFVALVEKETADAPGRSSNNYARINDDLTHTYTEGGQQVTVVMHRREGGLARLMFTRPETADDWATYDNLIPSSFMVSDEVKAAAP